MTNLNICQIIYNTFSIISLSKKKKTMLEIGVMFILNVCFNGHINSSILSTLSKIYSYKIRYFIRNSKMNFFVIYLCYAILIINFVVGISLLSGLPVYLIIDDTFVEKDIRSKNIIKGGKKRRKEGFSLLTAVLVIGCIEIPILMTSCYRKSVAENLGILYMSKIDKAMLYIQLFYNMGLYRTHTYLLLDSWYTSNNVINLVKNKLEKMVLIGGIKCNRNVDGKRIDNYTHTNPEKLNDENYLYELNVQTGNLNNVKGSFSILTSKRISLKKSYNPTLRYILCSDPNMNPLFILKHYQKRWCIEVFHRIFKFRFKPENWRIYGKKDKLIGIKSIFNLCVFCIMSLGFAIRYIAKNLDINTIKNGDFGESFISYSLSKVRPKLISENKKYEIFCGKLL